MHLLKDINKLDDVLFSKFISCVTVFLLLVSQVSLAEDIELYLRETIKQKQVRPKVLIIFDDSGSMRKIDDNSTATYDPIKIYGTPASVNYIYYTKSGDSIDELTLDDSRKFARAINGCQTSHAILNDTGFYSGKVKRYKFNDSGDGKWRSFPSNNGSYIKVVDCEDDVDFNNPVNAQDKDGNTLPSGYPLNNKGSQALPIYYTTSKADSNASWDANTVTLYSANYVRWYIENPPAPRSRLEVAKESVTNLINSAPGIDFGLEVFNANYDGRYHGGRILHGIKETTDSAKAQLLTIIDNLTHDGNTPLCESLYESYRYLGGKDVYYGNGKHSTRDVPDRDLTVETGNKYITPFINCDETIYVVIISDGEPTSDNSADAKIKALGNISSSDNFVISSLKTSYLPALAGWMYNNDINTTISGNQNAEVHTIGFGTDLVDETGNTDAAGVLIEAAKRGGGNYFPATDSASLTSALTSFLSTINPTNNSLTSASVASNNFDRTETLDSIYYAMFQPARGARWQGNLKKYKVIDGIQKGFKGVAAINSLTGHFSENVQSYWSSVKDGNSVVEGGVAEMLRNKTDRVIYSDLGGSNGLVKLTYAKATSSSVYSNQTELAAGLDVADDKMAIEQTLKWINGRDVDDDDDDTNTTENRIDVFGDPLHSKPVVINYGNDEIYIVVGTNHGVLHMFKDNDATNTIEETWAFMPKEFLPNINLLREYVNAGDKVYGVDGLITSHIVDRNGNGIVDGDDKVWLFFGYRRGGSSYYAMDVTKPAAPSVMWTIKGGQGDFKELGQTWSQPKIAYSKLNLVGSVAKPVLIFGGGYATSKDSYTIGGAGGEPDSKGKAIYMVDAETATVKWHLAPTGDTVFSGTDSIPSSIAILDSDGDGLTDRLYAGDTGGNVWRVDMPGNDKSKFSVFKLAEFGSNATNAADRRFFNEPSVVRTYITETINSGKNDSNGKAIIVQQDIPYDAVLIGSGDRTNPLGTDTDDVFFMIKDTNIKTNQFTLSSVPAIPAPIKIDDLADYTNNPFAEYLTFELTNSQIIAKQSLSLAVSLKLGWYIELAQSGEKSTATALVINNVVYYTTYTPPAENVDSCELANGQGWLYAVDLSLGVNKYNWQAEDSKNREDRIAFISEQFLGVPTLIVTKTTNPDTNVEEPDGNIIVGRKIIPVGFKLQTLRTYLYVTED